MNGTGYYVDVSILDAGVAALELVRSKLKIYRSSILKASVSGSLSAIWRMQNQAPELSSDLLKRILVERRCRWEEEQLDKFKKNDQKPPENWKLKYREPVTSETIDLSLMPSSWCMATVSQAFFIIDYRGRTPPFSDAGIAHLRSSNIKQGRVIWENLTYVTEETYSLFMTRGLPREGDILFTTEAPLGEAALAPTDRRFSLAQRIIILSPVSPTISPSFMLLQLMAPKFQAAIFNKGTGTTVTGVSSRNFRHVKIRIPPLAEQKAIVELVKTQFSIIDRLEADLDTMRKFVQTLRQSLFYHAFNGQLVSQDPNDEPASMLIKRIASEREARIREGTNVKQSRVRSKDK